MKKYNGQMYIGKAKYIVNFHDGVKTHQDGSEFWDIRIFRNRVLKNEFIWRLHQEGYKCFNHSLTH